MDNLKSIIENEKVKGAIAIAAAVIMFFTPSHIDIVIESLLTVFGIQQLVLKKKTKVSQSDHCGHSFTKPAT